MPEPRWRGGDVDVDPGLVEDRHDRLGQLLVEVVGEDVDEVDDPRARRVRPGRVSPSRAARRTKGVRWTFGSLRCRDRPTTRSSTQRAVALDKQGVGQDREPAGQPRPELDPREDPVDRRQSRGSRRRRPWPRASGSRRRRRTGIPTGRGCSGRRGRRSALNSSVPQSRGSTAPVGDLAEQVGLGARGGRLGPSARNVGHIRSVGSRGPAGAAAVAGRGHLHRAAIGRIGARRQDRRAAAAGPPPPPRRRPSHRAIGRTSADGGGGIRRGRGSSGAGRRRRPCRG